MKATHWIQNADHSLEELGEAHQLVIIELLREPTWLGGLEKLNGHLVIARKEGSCTPGLGVVADNGDIIHFCPDGDGEWVVHYHYDEKPKVLGGYPAGKKHSETVMEVTTERAEQMVMEFFAGARVSLV